VQDVNFSLFNFVAEQSNEVERLEDTLAQLKSEEGRLGAEAGDGGATSHQVVKELEVKIAAADNAAQKYEARYAEASKTVRVVLYCAAVGISHSCVRACPD
jgi:coiled-coil domain-containing protein 63/114